MRIDVPGFRIHLFVENYTHGIIAAPDRKQLELFLRAVNLDSDVNMRSIETSMSGAARLSIPLTSSRFDDFRSAWAASTKLIL